MERSVPILMTQSSCKLHDHGYAAEQWLRPPMPYRLSVTMLSQVTWQNNSNVYFPSASRVGRLTLYCQTSRGDFEQDQQASGAAQERRVRALHLRCRKFDCIALMVNMGCLMLWVHADFTHLVPLARRMLTPRQQAGLEIPSRC